jgi:ribosomal protein L37E
VNHPPPDPKRLAAEAYLAAQQREKVERPPLGLTCRRCGSTKFRVFSVRKLPGEIVRVRKCRRCRRKLYTFERPAR